MSFLRLASVFTFVCVPSLAFSQAVTSTSLSISAGGSVVTVSREGTAVTLTATVTLAGGAAAAPPGQVNFCEVKPPLQCTDIRLLGTAPLSSAGTANHIFFPGPGAHTYQAVFLGTHIEAASASAGTALSVTPPYYPTITTLASSGPPGDYSLTATVTTTGGSVSPTGSIDVMDTNNANYILATTSSLVPLPAGVGLNFGSVLSLPNYELGGPSLNIAADFNGDGKPDLAELLGVPVWLSVPIPVGDGSYEPYTIPAATVVLGNGDGTFTLTPLLPWLGVPFPDAMAVGDFNGDGKPDIAISAKFQSLNPALFPDIEETQIFLGNGDGTFTLGQTLPVGGGSMATADFNGDGIPDLVVQDAFPPVTGSHVYTVSMLLGKGDGTFTLKSHIPLPPSSASDGSSIGIAVAADFNGDGKADLAFIDSFDNLVIVWLGNGDGTFTPVSASTPTGGGFGNIGNIVAADFNGDGKLDLAVANALGVTGVPYYPGSIGILLGNGDGTFTPSTPAELLLGGITGASQLVVGDFNGDGNADLAIDTTTAFNIPLMSVFLGNGDGTFAPGQNYPGLNGTGLVAADVNGDGLTDLPLTEGRILETLIAEFPPQYAKATFSGISVVGTGTHQVDASYSGDSNYQPSVSPTIGLTAEPIPTALTLTASPTTINYGQPVTLTATLTPSAAEQNHLPSGTVTFSNGTTVVATGTLTNGVLIVTTTTLPSGTDILTATYSDDPNFAASTSNAVTVTVNGSESSTSLTASPNPAFYGQPVTLTVAVAEVGTAYPGIPGGTVDIYDGTAQIAQVTLDATGHATYTTSTLAVGSHTLTVVYPGNAAFYTSTSPPVTEVINIDADATTLTVSPHPSGFGETVTLSAAVAGTGFGASTTASGAVAFYDGATVLGPGTLDATGHAMFTTSTLAIGTHSLTAVYAGNAIFSGSTSNAVSEIVVKYDFSIALSSPASTLQTYQHTTTTVTLTPLGAITDNVTLTCASPPTYVTCIFTPNPASITPSGATTVSFYLDTDSIIGGDGMSGPLFASRGQPPSPIALALLLPPFGALVALTGRRRRLWPLLIAVLMLPAMLALASCGGNVITPIPSAAPGTYIIPVTATGAVTGLTHTAQLTLTVTP